MCPALDIPMDIVPRNQFDISSRSEDAMATSAYAILSGFTILVTGLIAVRLLLARRRYIKTTGKHMVVSGVQSPVS